MISCEAFRAEFVPATENPELLEHVRACDECLGIVADRDPDILFRAIGGGELLPPGGLDAFVDDVMREVRLRGTESAMVVEPRFGRARRLAIAATVAAAVTGSVFVYRHEVTSTPQPLSVHRASIAQVPVAAPRPVIESYDSSNATIVEVPSEGPEDVKVVMIFDESLPADL